MFMQVTLTVFYVGGADSVYVGDANGVYVGGADDGDVCGADDGDVGGAGGGGGDIAPNVSESRRRARRHLATPTDGPAPVPPTNHITDSAPQALAPPGRRRHSLIPLRRPIPDNFNYNDRY